MWDFCRLTWWAFVGLFRSRRALEAENLVLRQQMAMEDFIAKYNDRNPGKEVLYLNYAAVDPSLTNEKCSFWHFRWDASSDIKMEALTNYMKTRPAIKKVYLINQDYSFGQSVRAEARKMVAEKRPDIIIVGDELHPLLKITDFAMTAAPYFSALSTRF